MKITFDFDLELKDKSHSAVNNVGRGLVKKKLLILGSKETEMIDNSGIYHMYKDLYLSEKEHEKELFQGIQLANGLKALMDAKKADGTVLTFTTQKNAIKKTFDKIFPIPLDFEFFQHPVYPNGLKERLIFKLEGNFMY